MIGDPSDRGIFSIPDACNNLVVPEVSVYRIVQPHFALLNEGHDGGSGNWLRD